MPLLSEAYSEARLDLSKLDKDIKAATRKIEKAAKRLEQKLKLKVDLKTIDAERKLRNFEREVNRTRTRMAARGIDIGINVEVDEVRVNEAGRQARNAAERGFGNDGLVIKVDLDDGAFQRAYKKVAAQLRVLAAKRYKVAVDVEFDERGFSKLQDVLVGANESKRLKVKVEYDIDTEKARAEVAKARAELQALLAEQTAVADTAISVLVELDGTNKFLSELASIQAALDALPREVNVKVDTSKTGVPGVPNVGAAVTPQLGAEQLVQELQDAGIEVANLIQGADALRSLFNYDFSPVIKEQIPEFARALASKTRTAITDSIASLKDQVVNIGSSGSEGVVARAEAVTAALRTVPEEITTRFSVEADEFNAASIARVVAAAGEAREAAEEVVEQRSLDRGLKRRATAQAARTAQYEKFAKEAEKVALAAADKAARNLDDRQAQLDAAAARATADRRRLNFERLKRGTAALEARAVKADEQLDVDLRRAKVEDRQLKITTKFEGFARFIAQLAEGNRALDDIEVKRDVDVDTTSISGAIKAIVRDFEPVKKLLDGRGQGGGDLFDVSEATENAQRFFRSLPLLAEAAFTRVRRAGQGGGFDFTDATEKAQRYFRTLPILASTAAQRLRQSFNFGQGGGFDFTEAADSAKRYFRTLPIAAATAAARVKPILRDGFADAKDVVVEVRTKGLRKFFADMTKLKLEKIAAGRDIDINVDVDRRGGLKRGIASAARLAGGVVSGIGRGLSAAAGALSSLGEIGSAVGQRVQDAFSAASNQLADFAQQAGKALGAVAAAAGPIGSAVAGIVAALAGPALVSVAIGAVATLAGPVIAGVGGLIGGAIAFLGASAVAGLAAGGLPIAAVLLGPAKDELKKLLEPLKTQLLDAFAPTTDLIVQRIAPAFAAVASQLIPVVAKVSEGFITPIADSLFNLFANPALADAITRLSEPMANGIASIIDTFAKYVPLFTDIALQIGQPITDAVNAILEVIFTLGEVFAGDIAGAFGVIGDLFNDIRPTLASLGPILTPLVGLLAALIKAFVDASAGIEAEVGPIGPIINELSGAVLSATPALVALGVAFVEFVLPFIEGVIRSLPLASAAFLGLSAVIVGAAGVIVGVFGFIIQQFADFVAEFIGFSAALGRGVATVFDALGFDEQAEKIRGTADELEQWRANVAGLADGVGGLGGQVFNAANTLGEAAEGALGFGGATDRAGAAADAARSQIAQLDDELRAGKIGFADYAEEVAALGGSFDEASIAVAGAVDDIVKKVGEGEFAISKFADSVKRELNTASDFVETITVKDPVGQIREDRDRARAMQDLERQASRDVEQIGRNVEDYEQAIRDAAEIRSEAPKAYTFGARNFNRALFEDAAKRQQEYDERLADAERNISDRARAIDDARRAAEDSAIALEDAKYNAIFGEPEDIEVKVIDIREALRKGGQQLADEAERALTLIEIRSKGRKYDPLADFLEGLDPELFKSAFAQLGGIGTPEFEAAAAERERVVRETSTSFRESARAAADSIAEEQLRLDRLLALDKAGADALVLQLIGLDTEEFNRQYEEAETIGLGVANTIAQANVDAADKLLGTAEDAKRRGLEIGNASLKGLEEAYGSAPEGGVIGDETSRKIQERFKGGPGFGGGSGTPAATEAAEVGRETAEGYISGFTGVFATQQGESLFGVVGEVVATFEDKAEAFAVAGQDGAEKFYDGLKSALSNSTNREFVYGAIGGVILGITLKGTEFAAAGATLGGSVIAGVTDGLNVNSVTINGAVQLLAGTIATEAVTEAWRTSGVTLGQAVLNGIRDGIEVSRAFLTGKLGAVRVGVGLQAESFRLAGAELGVAIVVGAIAAIQLRTSLVVLSVQAVALATLGAVQNWGTAGTTLAAAFILALMSRIAQAAGEVSGAVQQLVSQLNLNLLVGAGVNIGTAIVAGLIQGILNGREGVENAARIIARAAADASSKELEINSPSRVFMRLGEQTAEGFALGVTSGAGGIGSGMGAVLTGQVAAASNSAVYNQQQSTATTDQSVTESTVIYVSNPDPYATAAEIAQRQRSRRYLNGGRR